jgi:integrase
MPLVFSSWHLLEGLPVARIPKPWFREDRKTWFVNINGERHNLGADAKLAKRKFHELMAASDAKPAAEPVKDGFTLAEIFDKFLDWCGKHRSPNTYEWSRCRIQMFIDALGEAVNMAAVALKPFHISEWTDQHTDPSDDTISKWSSTYRHGIIAAIQRPLNWAVRMGYIHENPIRFIEKPAVTRREAVVTPDTWPKIRDRYKEGDPFRELLEFAWETGCRPEEVKKIEARHVQIEQHRIVFPKVEAKGKKKPRVIYMTPRAEAIIKARLRPAGFVFLNANGQPWKSWALNNRFCRLEKHVGAKFCAYSFRHGFGTRKLEEGLDHLTVAALMGHQDGSMLAKFYSHIGEREDYLLDKLNGSRDENMSKS